jgi:hypothetical protein
LKRIVDAERYCAAARNRDGIEGLPRLWLEVQLVDAEVRLLIGNAAAVDLQQIEALSAAGDASKPSADNWRALALLAAIQPGAAADAARTGLTHNLATLRMSWGEATFQSWRRRADVASLLAKAGVP